MSQSLYLIDGHYQIYRAYYAPFPPLTSASGEPTKAIHAFMGMLFRLIRHQKPDYLAMLMDTSEKPVFRQDLYPDYKANREPPPEDFHPQKKRIVSIVQAMGIPVLKMPGFEADDLMATIAEKMAPANMDVYLVSRDKDLEQLITPGVSMLDPTDGKVLDADALFDKKGYRPEQVIDIQNLTGDKVDNIPGIMGVGIKTAVKLINKYGSAASAVAHAHELTPKMSERVSAFADQLSLTRELVTLRRDIPFDFDLDACRFNGVIAEKVRPIFEELTFTRLWDQLESMAIDTQSGTAAQTSTVGRTSTVAQTTESNDATKSDTPRPTLVPTDRGAATRDQYEQIDTEEKLTSLIQTLSKQDHFAFDTETTGLNPVAAKMVGISIAWEPERAIYIPILAATGNVLPLELIQQKLGPIFENPNIRKSVHNLKYDIIVMNQAGIEVHGAWFDSLIASFLLDPMRRSHGLDALSLEVLNHQMIPISDLIGKGKNQTTMDQLDAARVGEYAAEDADFTLRLVNHYTPRMANDRTRELFETVEMPLVEVLARMEQNGVAIDTNMLDEMSIRMAKRMESLTYDIHDAAEHPFNVDSTKQLAEVLFDEQGLEVIRKTKTGRSTDADTLTTLAETTTNPIPKLVLEYRELAKLKGTYVDTLPKMIIPKTNRIHASFHQTGAATGRLSSSNPNLQNIPIRTEQGREIRRAFTASNEENVLLVADYSQAELRVMAHFSGDEALCKAFHDGRDIHAFVAAQVNGVNIDEVTKEQRAAAKAVNFGIIYGQTAFGLSRSLGIPMAEASAFINNYFLRYPGIRWFIDGRLAEAKKKGYVETLLGRRRSVEELKSRNKQQIAVGERIAINTIIQGTAADLIKKAMVDIDKAIRENNLPVKMLIQVHDELVFEVPEREVESAAKMVREKMCNAIKFNVPLEVDLCWGKNWLEAK